MNFIKISIFAITTFLTINSFSNDVYSKPKVKVRVIAPRVRVVTTVKTRPCHKWIKGYYRRNRHGHLIWVPGHWKRV